MSVRRVASPRRPVGVVGAATLAWIVGEFLLRRTAGRELAAVVGSARGWDALVLLGGFPLLAGLVVLLGTRAGVGRTDWDLRPTLRGVAAGVGGAVAVRIVGVAIAAVVVLSGVELPSGTAAIFGDGRPEAWVLVAFLLGNTLVGPVAEEIAYRGVIQTALTRRFSVAVGVAVTGVVFVAKHLVVDFAGTGIAVASPLFATRVATLAALATVLGLLRARYGTGSAVVAHVLVNGLLSVGLVVAVL